jgi:hypothetical protein
VRRSEDLGGGKFWEYGCESRSLNAPVSWGAEPQGSKTGVGNAIAMSLRDAFEDAIETEAAQGIGHLSLRLGFGRFPEQRCDVWAEVVVGKP